MYHMRSLRNVYELAGEETICEDDMMVCNIVAIIVREDKAFSTICFVMAGMKVDDKVFTEIILRSVWATNVSPSGVSVDTADGLPRSGVIQRLAATREIDAVRELGNALLAASKDAMHRLAEDAGVPLAEMVHANIFQRILDPENGLFVEMLRNLPDNDMGGTHEKGWLN